jgi:hypothetical protein
MPVQYRNARAGVGTAVVAAVVLLFSAGCSNGDTGASGTAAKSGNCAANAYQDPKGLYCVVVPDGYVSIGPTTTQDTKSSDQWNNAAGFTFDIDYWPADQPGGTLEDMKSNFELSLKDSNLQKLDSAQLDGGGLYERFHNPVTNENSMRSVIQAGNKVIECQAVYDDPITPDNACKTLHGR